MREFEPAGKAKVMTMASRYAAIVFCVVLCQAAVAGPVKHVVIISIDGGKPSVIRKSRMPNLLRMVSEGAHTWNAQAVMPSVTLVNHTSMLTGVAPAKHKVLWNDWRPKRGHIKAQTVFGFAKKAGLSTAVFAGKEKFKHFNIPDSVDRCQIPGYASDKVATAAARYIRAHKPNLIFIHLADADGAGHTFGWGSERQKLALANVDSGIGLIRKALEDSGIVDSLVVLISADHGGHARTHGTSSPEDMTIPWIAWGANVRRGRRISSLLKTFDTAATALYLLGIPKPENWDGRPVEEAFAFKSTDSPR